MFSKALEDRKMKHDVTDNELEFCLLQYSRPLVTPWSAWKSKLQLGADFCSARKNRELNELFTIDRKNPLTEIYFFPTTKQIQMNFLLPCDIEN
jgi:hypothetical protein